MGIPAELRNRIYEYALSEPTPIEVTGDLKQPPLLSACRLIRAEAKQLWYAINGFEFHICDYDARLLERFHRHVCAVLTERAVSQMHYSMRMDLPPHWANLMA